MENLQQQVAESKAQYIELRDAIKDSKRQKEVFKLEIESLYNELKALEEQIISAMETVELINKEISDLQDQFQKVQNDYDTKKEELEKVKYALAECSSEIANLEKEKVKCEEEKAAALLNQKMLRTSLSQIDREILNAQNGLQGFLRKYPWIEREKNFFGREGTDFDFEAVNVNESKERLRELKDRQRALGRKINKKVMGMLEKAEGEYDTLMSKREAIENDKRKIESVIEELDIKKNQALHTTWTKVNRDFGSIFSTLLPGTSAKLEPPEGGDVCEDGLEVKVAFGSVWKESLTELSGGQRSLLALSLILSLLLFKPAPMYILDEVDAALDLSHTQNIGTMLKTHFSQSQFVVVSLKEGMFNNANVIFRTKFVDGVSTVTRTTNGMITNHEEEEEEEERKEYDEEEDEESEDAPPRKRRSRNNNTSSSALSSNKRSTRRSGRGRRGEGIENEEEEEEYKESITA